MKEHTIPNCWEAQEDWMKGFKPFLSTAFVLVLGALMSACGHSHSPSPSSGPAMGIDTKSLPRTYKGLLYDAQIQVSNAKSPVAFSVGEGRLCDGLTLKPDGQITGHSTKAEICGFSVKAKDSQGQTAQQNLSIDVRENGPPGQ
jgi:hypothetical protein